MRIAFCVRLFAVLTLQYHCIDLNMRINKCNNNACLKWPALFLQITRSLVTLNKDIGADTQFLTRKSLWV